MEITYDGKTHRIGAGFEVVLSLGAIQTPKVLMQSGIGDQAELQRLGIPVVQHLPGVGQNFQDHPVLAASGSIRNRCRRATTRARRPSSGRAILVSDTPDMQTCQVELPLTSAEMRPDSICQQVLGQCCVGLVRPKSRGRIRLTGPNPLDPVQIERQYLVSPGRPEGRDSLRGTLSRDRQLRCASPVHQARGDAGQPERGRSSKTSSGMPSLPTGIRHVPPRWAVMPCRWWMAS